MTGCLADFAVFASRGRQKTGQTPPQRNCDREHDMLCIRTNHRARPPLKQRATAFRRIVGGAAAVLAGAVVTTAAAQVPSRAVPAADAPPRAVVEAGDAARYLFDAARDGRWHEADSQLAALQTDAANLPESRGEPALRRSLRTRMRQLSGAVGRRQRVRTMEAANEVAHITADLTQTYHTIMPAQLPLLDYYGRQLQIGIAARRPALIRHATANIREAWNAVRRDYERRARVDDVRRLTDIVVSLEGAKRQSDIERLARAELEEVGRLETAPR